MPLRVLILFFLGFETLFGGFITQEEYASSFYHNPRGIGCHLCHGERGEGRVVARYREKGARKTFEGAPIVELTYGMFKEQMGKRHVGMPHYYLTDGEVRLLYHYLHYRERGRYVSRTR